LVEKDVRNNAFRKKEEELVRLRSEMEELKEKEENKSSSCIIL
jgi:hypothetical protein